MMKRCWAKAVEVYDSRRLVKVGTYVLLLVSTASCIGVSAKSSLEGIASMEGYTDWAAPSCGLSILLPGASRLAARDLARSKLRKYKAARALQRLLEGCAAVTSMGAATLIIFILIAFGAFLPWLWWCLALLPLALCAILEAMVWTSRRAEGSGVKRGWGGEWGFELSTRTGTANPIASL